MSTWARFVAQRDQNALTMALLGLALVWTVGRFPPKWRNLLTLALALLVGYVVSRSL